MTFPVTRSPYSSTPSPTQFTIPQGISYGKIYEKVHGRKVGSCSVSGADEKGLDYDNYGGL